jgi:uncharacterized RDD family membrane protein YckC
LLRCVSNSPREEEDLANREDALSGIAAETVLGLDNAALTLPVAGVGSRVLAALADGLIQGVLQLIWLLVCFVAAGGFDGTLRYVVYAFGAFLLDWAYFAGLEIAMRGRTPGKKMVGLRVVSRTGGTASKSALAVRNLLRPVDLLVGVLLMVLDPLSRRLGDRLAGTLVVHDRTAEDEPLLRRIPKGWQAQDVALVESLLRRIRDLEGPRADAMAYRVIERLEREEPSFLEGARGGGDGPVAVLRRAFDVKA